MLEEDARRGRIFVAGLLPGEAPACLSTLHAGPPVRCLDNNDKLLSARLHHSHLRPLPGGNADQKYRSAKLDWTRLAPTAVQEGDVLRALTTTTVQFGSGAVVGDLSGSSRVLGVYGADGQKWPQVMAALKRGYKADGEVTLILERQAVAQPTSSGSGSSEREGSSDGGDLP